MTGKSAVIISGVHWHSTWQRHHHIASQLASTGWKIIFIEPLPKRWPAAGEWKRLVNRLSGRSEGAGTCVQNVPEGVEILSPLLLPDVGFIARGVNKLLFIPLISEVILNKLSGEHPLLINYLPTPASIALQKKLPARVRVYDCVCDWAHDPYAVASGLEQAEKDLLNETDIVTADSIHNYKRMQALHPRVFQLEGGVEYERFEPARHPRKRENPPLCVYFGDIGVHSDLELLAKVSHRFRLKLIGPVRLPLTGFSDKAEILGPVHYDKLPELLAEADVLLLPYRNTAHNQGVLPAKTFECLATGKPTVVINLPSLQVYSNLFYLCSTHEEFLSSIEKSAFEDTSKMRERQEAAAQHSWTVKVSELLKMTGEIYGRG